MKQYKPINIFNIDTYNGSMVIECDPNILEQAKENNTILYYSSVDLYKVENIKDLETITELRKLYFDFIDFIDPYHEDEEPDKDEELSEMLYNLIEIRKDWNFEPGTEEATRINTLIELFQVLGVKPCTI